MSRSEKSRPPAPFDPSHLDTLRQLARLRPPPDRSAALEQRLHAVQQAFASVGAADAGEDSAGPPKPAPLRDDEPARVLSQQETLANTDAVAGCFLVPRVVEG